MSTCPRNTYLKANQRLTLVILIWRRSGRLPPNDRQLHMFDLKPHEQEINSTNNHILEMIFGFGVFEFDMQAVLDTNIHLDRAVVFWGHAVRVNPEILLTDDIRHAP